MADLIEQYESKKSVDLEDILDFHVKFERIRPYEDCNGRVGRLIMLKECLRHGIIPFIIDDKRRTGYLDGIRCWDDDPDVLMDVCIEAQLRFEAQIALQGLLECQSRYTGACRKRSCQTSFRQSYSVLPYAGILFAVLRSYHCA